MKQLLLSKQTNFRYWSTLQKGNSILSLFYRLALLFLGCWMAIPAAYGQNIIIDGNSHLANAIGTFQDLTLPVGNTVKSMSFTLVGGDGGTAEVHDSYIIPAPPFIVDVSHISNGGNSAMTSATFPVGNGAGEIPPGSLIRFVEGDRGQSGSSAGVAGNGFSYGGGGGSAVLYRENSSSPWIILAVAGGGGAYQGMAVYLAVDSDAGEGGRQTQGDGSGGGGNIGFGGGGGGKNSNGGGVLCVGLNGSTTAGEGGAGGTGIGYGGDSDGMCILHLA